MPGYSVTAANQALDGLLTPVNVLAFTNLNTADPVTTGVSESAATRQASTWNAAATRNKTNSGAMTFAPAAGVANTHFSTWSAVTAGTFGISGTLGSAVTASSVTVAAGALVLSA